MSSSHPIERYYDRNTRWFLALGGGAAAGAIHRQLWGPGVATVAEASSYVNRLLADAVAGLRLGRSPTLLDLGCGVGGTLIHLAGRFPDARLFGVSISRRQIGRARRASAAAGIGERIVFRYGDFESVRLGIEAGVAWAVEAYAHSRCADRFFATAARHLRARGRLIVVDDFLLDDEAGLPAAGRRWARDFRRGWRVPSFGTVADCTRAARRHGLALIEDLDLTPLIRLGRSRDRAIAVIAPAIDRLGLARGPLGGNLVGGNALQQGLGAGLFAYRWLCFGRD